MTWDPGDSDGKEFAYNAGERCSIPGLERSPWRREWQPTSVFMPGKSHGQRSLAGYVHGVTKRHDWSNLACAHKRYLRRTSRWIEVGWDVSEERWGGNHGRSKHVKVRLNSWYPPRNLEAGGHLTQGLFQLWEQNEKLRFNGRFISAVTSPGYLWRQLRILCLFSDLILPAIPWFS